MSSNQPRYLTSFLICIRWIFPCVEFIFLHLGFSLPENWTQECRLHLPPQDGKGVVCMARRWEKETVVSHGCCTEAEASINFLLVPNNAPRRQHDLGLAHPNIQFGQCPTPPPHSSNQELITTFKTYYTRGTYRSIFDPREKDTAVRVGECRKSQVWSTFYVVRETLVKFCLHAANMKFNI